MNAQEEVKARLEVAQLYEEMGQNPKAARYYLAAAEICLKSKLYGQAQGFLEKVLELDPDNAQGQSYLERLEAHLAAHGMSKPTASSEASSSAPEGDGKLTVPTPALYLNRDQVSAILSQVSSAPNPKFFPFDPLPDVDVGAIARKAEAAEAKRQEQRDKERTSVASAFGSGESSFKSGAGSGFLGQAKAGGRKSRKEREGSEEDSPLKAKGRGKRRGKDKGTEGRRKRGRANQSLADSLSRRVKGG